MEVIRLRRLVFINHTGVAFDAQCKALTQSLQLSHVRQSVYPVWRLIDENMLYLCSMTGGRACVQRLQQLAVNVLSKKESVHGMQRDSTWRRCNVSLSQRERCARFHLRWAMRSCRVCSAYKSAASCGARRRYFGMRPHVPAHHGRRCLRHPGVQWRDPRPSQSSCQSSRATHETCLRLAGLTKHPLESRRLSPAHS